VISNESISIIIFFRSAVMGLPQEQIPIEKAQRLKKNYLPVGG
jgi:hypothetical protein